MVLLAALHVFESKICLPVSVNSLVPAMNILRTDSHYYFPSCSLSSLPPSPSPSLLVLRIRLLFPFFSPERESGWKGEVKKERKEKYRKGDNEKGEELKGVGRTEKW